MLACIVSHGTACGQNNTYQEGARDQVDNQYVYVAAVMGQITTVRSGGECVGG